MTDRVQRSKWLGFGMICGGLLLGFMAVQAIFHIWDREEPVTLTLANNLKSDVCTSVALDWFAEKVKERTDGRVQIEVYHDGELGDSVTCLEQLQYGGIDMVKADLSVMANFVPEYHAFVMPYLYSNQEHFWAVQGGKIGMELLRGDKMKGQQMYGLTYYDAGARCFYSSKKPIQSPEDLKGMRVRIQQSRLMMSVMEALGAEPVVMEYEDIYPALQDGSIAAGENSIVNYLKESFYQEAPYFLNDCHTRSADILVMSEKTRSELSEKDLEIIDQTALESWEYQKQLWAEAEADARRQLEDKQVAVTELSAEELAQFQKVCEPVWYTYDDGAYNDLLDRIVAVGKDMELQERLRQAGQGE